MYCEPNFKTKKALKEAVKAGELVTVYPTGGESLFGRGPRTEGTATLEGPHYPEPHRWYARVKLENGRVVKVVS